MPQRLRRPFAERRGLPQRLRQSLAECQSAAQHRFRRRRWSARGTLASIRDAFYSGGIDMDTVTLSPKFQVVIPQAIREALHLKAGEKLRVLRYGDRLEFIPVRPIQEMRGFLRGMVSAIGREEDRL